MAIVFCLLASCHPVHVNAGDGDMIDVTNYNQSLHWTNKTGQHFTNRIEGIGDINLDLLTITNTYDRSAVTNITVDSDEITIKGNDGFMFIVQPAPELITNLVNNLIASGDVCRIKGHRWDPLHGMKEQEREAWVYNRPYVEKKCRGCLLCGLHQTLTTEWK